MKHLLQWLPALLLVLLVPLYAAGAETSEADDEGIELERTVELQARLISVERVPMRETTAIARFRVTEGEYRGATFSLAYDFMPPVRLRSWDMHDGSGYRRLGGAPFSEPATGQWDELLRPGSHEPVESLFLSLIEHDLNEDEEDRRWHAKRVETILPLERYHALQLMGLSAEQSALRPDG